MASLISQLAVEAKSAIYARGLAVASGLGLDVASWGAADPTRSLFHFLSSALADLEVTVAGYAGTVALDYASGPWLTLLASQVFQVERDESTYASTVVTLSNSGGGYYEIEPGDVRVRNSASGATFTNTSGGTLTGAFTPGATLRLDVRADEAGTGSTSMVHELDELVTTMIGVTCSNATAAIGRDEESDAALRDRCRAKLGTLSACGPRDSYDYVVRSSDLTGSDEITRSRTLTDDATGAVRVIVGSASGAVTGAALADAQTAVDRYSAPHCFRATVENCVTATIPITYELWAYDSIGDDEATIEANVLAALSTMIAARPIGGDIIAPATTGAIYQSLIAATIRDTYPDHAFRVVVLLPATDTALAVNEAVALGTVLAAISIEAAP